MSNLMNFNDSIFGQLRVHIDESGNHWFIASDVCRALELENVSRALERLDEDEVDDITTSDTIDRQQQTKIINESGLYSLIMTSRKPSAKKFKKWVTSEVLPSIRKTGSYNHQVQPNFTDPAEAAIAWALEYREKQKLLIENNQKQVIIDTQNETIDSIQEIISTKYGRLVNVTTFSRILSEKFSVIEGDKIYYFSPSNQDLNKFFISDKIIFKNGTQVSQKTIDRYPGLFVKNDLFGTWKIDLESIKAMEFIHYVKSKMIKNKLGLKKLGNNLNGFEF